MIDSQLLCTFSNKKELTEMVLLIKESAPLSMKKLYVLQRTDNPNDLMVTYNVLKSEVSGFLPNTILLHRKKETNTLYTINALNELIKKLNGGVVDTKFPITWEHYKNSVLLTQHDELKQLKTKIHKIIEL